MDETMGRTPSRCRVWRGHSGNVLGSNEEATMMQLIFILCVFYGFLFLQLLMAFGWTAELVISFWTVIVGSGFGWIIGLCSYEAVVLNGPL